MPELPEVEVVRRGLERWTLGRRIARVDVLRERSVRRHVRGPIDFAERLVGARVLGARRRGKFLWLPLDDGEALMAHLGMSGQLLLQPVDEPDETHLRVRIRFDDDGRELRFVDQRTFGSLAVEPLESDPGAGPATDAAAADNVADNVADDVVPGPVQHIARDPLDPAFDGAAFARALRRRRTGLKRALLDQTLVSGIGNIYADEALWRARLHYARPTETLPRRLVDEVVRHARDVMNEALEQGGTSFDSLYVDVNGSSGYFDRSLNAYGREDEPCARCGAPIRREPFMNRSSYRCPRCQRVPRGARW